VQRNRLFDRGQWNNSQVRVAFVAAVFGLGFGLIGNAEQISEPPAKTTAANAMDWWSVDAGGGAAASGAWALQSIIGQPDAGRAAGGAFSIEGGFALPPEPMETPLFVDGFESGDTGAWSAASGVSQ